MLASDVSVEQAVGLFFRGVENLLGVCAERDLDRSDERRLPAGARVDHVLEAFRCDNPGADQTADERAARFQDAQEQMLSVDGTAPEHTGFVASEEQRSPGLFVKPLKHGCHSMI